MVLTHAGSQSVNGFSRCSDNETISGICSRHKSKKWKLFRRDSGSRGFPIRNKKNCLEQIKDLGTKYVSTLSWSTRRLSAALSSPISDYEPNTQPSCLDSFISKMHQININHHQTYNTCICNHIMHVCLFCSIVYGHMVHLYTFCRLCSPVLLILFPSLIFDPKKCGSQ